MKSTTGTFPAEDGTALYWHHWDPDKEPVGTVCLCHGIGEHLGRYAHVARALADAGLSLLAFDLRGHGRSGGLRGHTPSFDLLLRDLERLIGRAPEARPVFLYGHSMGGLIAIQLCLRTSPSVRGFVGTGPWLRLRFRPPLAKVLMTRLIKGIYPSLTVRTGLNVDGLSRDKDVVRAYTTDPLVHDRVSAVMGHSMLDAGGWALARASEFRLPALLMHGEEDPLTDPQATKLFYESMGSQDKTLRIWPGLRHEIHNEPEKAEVIAFMVDWLRARL